MAEIAKTDLSMHIRRLELLCQVKKLLQNERSILPGKANWGHISVISLKIKEVNEEINTYVIDKECVKHGVKFPKFAVIDDGAPNAFTYGRTKKDARIVVTRGIFELLNEDEVKAVVAHEMGHIVHLDMLVMTAVQIVPLVLYAIYEAFARNNRGDRDNNKAAIIGYIAYLLYIVSQYIILWLSRTREYYADEFSVTETENPNSLAEALVKVGFGLSTKSGESKRNVS